jgi:hypothetical protein
MLEFYEELLIGSPFLKFFILGKEINWLGQEISFYLRFNGWKVKDFMIALYFLFYLGVRIK